MADVSPSLVEAAARALLPRIRKTCPYRAHNESCKDCEMVARDAAELALAAVGDALRLEGAQAARERAIEAWVVLRCVGYGAGEVVIDSVWAAAPAAEAAAKDAQEAEYARARKTQRGTLDDVADAFWVVGPNAIGGLDEIGGVHPEASDG